MRSSKRNIVSVLLALFMWSQIFSLCGAFETFSSISLDDIDPEDVVTMDPFLVSNSIRISQELDVLQHVVAAGFATLFAFWRVDRYFELTVPVLPDSNFGDNRLWLRHCRLLI